jgi:hypothetical protein
LGYGAAHSCPKYAAAAMRRIRKYPDSRFGIPRVYMRARW